MHVAHTVFVPVQLSRPLLTATTLTASVSGGDARIPNQTTQVSIAAGETTASLPVAVTGNTVDEADVTAVVTLTGAGGAIVGDPSTATVILRDDDVPPAVPCPGGVLRPAVRGLLQTLGLGNLVCRIP